MLIVSAKARALFGAVIVAFAGSACHVDLTVWKTAVPSPNQQWIASADTVQNGGFGGAHIATSVYLRRAGDAGPGVRVLEFSCQGPIPHPYVLDNLANAGGSIHLLIKWLDNSRLDVSYDGHPELIFQAVRFRDVRITVEDLSGTVPEKHT